MIRTSFSVAFVYMLVGTVANAQLLTGPHAPCNVCGTTGLAVTIPLASIGNFEGINFGNCMTLSAAAQSGFISPTQCVLLQSADELKENCGCDEPQTQATAAKGKTPTVATVGPPTIAPGSNPVCYVCGSQTAQATKLDAIIEVPPELNSPIPVVPCGTIVEAGLNQLIPESACVIARETPEFAEVCGCVDIQQPTAPPMLPPTGFPTEAPAETLADEEPITITDPNVESTEAPTSSPAAAADDEVESGCFTIALTQTCFALVIAALVW